MYCIPSFKIDKKTKIWTNNEPIPTNKLSKYVDPDGKIFFGEKFNYPLNFLDNSVKYIFFTDCEKITHPLNYLPESVIGIIFINETDYSSELDNLPNGLEILVFSETTYFNSPINNLPNGLKKLVIQSIEFSQSVDMLPESLEELTLNHTYSQSINSLPKNLKKLSILSTKLIINKLPENLKYLQIDICGYEKNIDFLPEGLKILNIKCRNIKQLKNINFPQINNLIIEIRDSKKYKDDIIIDNLPNSLVTFQIITTKDNFIINPMPELINTLKIYGVKIFDINKYIVPNKDFVITSNFDIDDTINDDIDVNQGITKLIINYF